LAFGIEQWSWPGLNLNSKYFALGAFFGTVLEKNRRLNHCIFTLLGERSFRTLKGVLAKIARSADKPKTNITGASSLGMNSFAH
jgi:hypothetical protein